MLTAINTLVCAARGLGSAQPKRRPLRPENDIRALKKVVADTGDSFPIFRWRPLCVKSSRPSGYSVAERGSGIRMVYFNRRASQHASSQKSNSEKTVFTYGEVPGALRTGRASLQLPRGDQRVNHANCGDHHLRRFLPQRNDGNTVGVRFI